ncbi:hypothetical protein [Pseudonocardia xishanensis]|uniref:Magnesium transporter NIPA n=1 Tax=Pseudonocardia xishanensis TaxID=630995 RepID=A0ABP8RSH2_9PSEU
MTALALALAVLGAACFGGAAVLQHGEIDGRRLDPTGLRALAARPRWLAGTALAAAGAGLHVGALVLAPVSVVQPVGVLAVPVAVVLALGRPRGRVLVGIGLCVGGVALVVRVISALPTAPPSDSRQAVLLASAAAAAAVLALAGVAARATGRLRCLACATGAAIAFGLVSAVLRATALQVAAGRATPAALLGAAAGVAVALAAGGWLVQQAFACGPPGVVVAVLTVADPLVAVGAGAALLGEAAGLDAPTTLLLVLFGATAACGVALLARFHPDARPVPEEREVLT